MNITPFVFLDAVEKAFIAGMAGNEDFKQGRFERERIIDLFKKESKMHVKWWLDGATRPVVLSAVHVQSIKTKEEDAVAFKVSFGALDFKQTGIALIRDEEEFVTETEKFNVALRAVTLLALREYLPEGVSLQSDLDELMKSVVPNWRPRAEGKVTAEKVENQEEQAVEA